jgi:integrase
MSSTKRRGAGEGSIRLRSDGRWEGRYELGWTVEGRRRRSVFGTTRQDVVTKLRTAFAQQERGEPPTDERTTVSAFLERWLRGLPSRVRPGTTERYSTLLRKHVIPTLGGVKLARLTPQHVEALLSEKLAEGLSPRTVWCVRSTLRTALADAVRSGEVSRNAAGLSRPPHVEGYHVEPMAPSQAVTILDSVAGSDLEAPVTLAMFTGLRLGEVLGLRWEDVDLSVRRLRVEGALHRRAGAWVLELAKTDRSRRSLVLPEPAVEVLAQHRQRQLAWRLQAGPRWRPSIDGLVFTRPSGQPMWAPEVTRRFRVAQETAGLRSVRFHDLRHAAATLMLASGTDLKVVSEVLGHSTIATTANVYAGVLDTLKVDAADRLARLVRRPG